ncbi:MAG: hypothetical protein KGQ41_06475, partial [Alphaproteobacteria bacterium]|nr:hypothetical protein [Alphaproteobacteria bacterium]
MNDMSDAGTLDRDILDKSDLVAKLRRTADEIMGVEDKTPLRLKANSVASFMKSLATDLEKGDLASARKKLTVIQEQISQKDRNLSAPIILPIGTGILISQAEIFIRTNEALSKTLEPTATSPLETTDFVAQLAAALQDATAQDVSDKLEAPDIERLKAGLTALMSPNAKAQPVFVENALSAILIRQTGTEAQSLLQAIDANDPSVGTLVGLYEDTARLQSNVKTAGHFIERLNDPNVDLDEVKGKKWVIDELKINNLAENTLPELAEKLKKYWATNKANLGKTALAIESSKAALIAKYPVQTAEQTFQEITEEPTTSPIDNLRNFANEMAKALQAAHPEFFATNIKLHNAVWDSIEELEASVNKGGYQNLINARFDLLASVRDLGTAYEEKLVGKLSEAFENLRNATDDALLWHSRKASEIIALTKDVQDAVSHSLDKLDDKTAQTVRDIISTDICSRADAAEILTALKQGLSEAEGEAKTQTDALIAEIAANNNFDIESETLEELSKIGFNLITAQQDAPADTASLASATTAPEATATAEGANATPSNEDQLVKHLAAAIGKLRTTTSDKSTPPPLKKAEETATAVIARYKQMYGEDAAILTDIPYAAATLETMNAVYNRKDCKPYIKSDAKAVLGVVEKFASGEHNSSYFAQVVNAGHNILSIRVALGQIGKALKIPDADIAELHAAYFSKNAAYINYTYSLHIALNVVNAQLANPAAKEAALQQARSIVSDMCLLAVYTDNNPRANKRFNQTVARLNAIAYNVTRQDGTDAVYVGPSIGIDVTLGGQLSRTRSEVERKIKPLLGRWQRALDLMDIKTGTAKSRLSQILGFGTVETQMLFNDYLDATAHWNDADKKAAIKNIYDYVIRPDHKGSIHKHMVEVIDQHVQAENRNEMRDAVIRKFAKFNSDFKYDIGKMHDAVTQYCNNLVEASGARKMDGTLLAHNLMMSSKFPEPAHLSVLQAYLEEVLSSTQNLDKAAKANALGKVLTNLSYYYHSNQKEDFEFGQELFDIGNARIRSDNAKKDAEGFPNVLKRAEKEISQQEQRVRGDIVALIGQYENLSGQKFEQYEGETEALLNGVSQALAGKPLLLAALDKELTFTLGKIAASKEPKGKKADIALAALNTLIDLSKPGNKRDRILKALAEPETPTAAPKVATKAGDDIAMAPKPAAKKAAAAPKVKKGSRIGNAAFAYFVNEPDELRDPEARKWQRAMRNKTAIAIKLAQLSTLAALAATKTTAAVGGYVVGFTGLSSLGGLAAAATASGAPYTALVLSILGTGGTLALGGAITALPVVYLANKAIRMYHHVRVAKKRDMGIMALRRQKKNDKKASKKLRKRKN